MMSEEKMTLVFITLFMIVVLVAVIVGSERIDKYEDTIDEYMMCIEYSPDCECSDIILSEYGEEVE